MPGDFGRFQSTLRFLSCCYRWAAKRTISPLRWESPPAARLRWRPQLRWKEMPGASSDCTAMAPFLSTRPWRPAAEKSLAKTAPRHTRAEFVDFLAQVVASQPPGREIHVIPDNLATHKTRSSSTTSRRVIPRSTFILPNRRITGGICVWQWAARGDGGGRGGEAARAR